MAARTYLWLEDREGKAGSTFWKTLMSYLYPDVIVESKRNNSELVKAVKSLTDRECHYIILYDNSFDNTQIYMEQKMLKSVVASKENVSLVSFICFEFILLEFDELIEWIYEEEDEFLKKRAPAISAREQLVKMIHSGELNYKAINEVLEYDKNIKNHNIEQLSARLLFDLTRNTGFEVSKGSIGDCWVKSCCEWVARQENDVCGLDNRRLTLEEKMRAVYYGTGINAEFSSMGMEVPS